jgi:hypothetical protein
MEFLFVLTEAAFSLRMDKSEALKIDARHLSVLSRPRFMERLSRSTTTSQSGRAAEKVRGDVKYFCNSMAAEIVELIRGSSYFPSIAMMQVVTRKSNSQEERWGSHIWKSEPTKSRGKQDIAIELSPCIIPSTCYVPLATSFRSTFWLQR